PCSSPRCCSAGGSRPPSPRPCRSCRDTERQTMSTSFWPLIKFVPPQTHFKFTRLAPFAAILSGLAVIASVVSFMTVGLNLGLDFKGGTVIEFSTPGPAPLAQIRDALGKSGVKDPGVQGLGAPNSA